MNVTWRYDRMKKIEMRVAKLEEEDKIIPMRKGKTSQLRRWDMMMSTKEVLGIDSYGCECKGTLLFIQNVPPDRVLRNDC